ncbi:MAG TPA: hypothetical protein VJG32_12700 [Anaerolineae bacterium]|nr:hypothetical protein [Anaerolineae bacterium]
MLTFAHATVVPAHSVYEIGNCELLVNGYRLTWDKDYVTFSRIVDYSTIFVPRERNFAYKTLRCFVSAQSMLVQHPLSIKDFRWNLLDDTGEIRHSRERSRSIEFARLEAIAQDSFEQHLPATQRVLELLPSHPELFFALTDFNLAHNAETDDLRLMYAWRAWEQLRGAMPGGDHKKKGKALRALLPNVSDYDFEFLERLTNDPYMLTRHASEDPSRTQLPHPMDAQVFQLIVRDAIVNYVSYLLASQPNQTGT